MRGKRKKKKKNSSPQGTSLSGPGTCVIGSQTPGSGGPDEKCYGNNTQKRRVPAHPVHTSRPTKNKLSVGEGQEGGRDSSNGPDYPDDLPQSDEPPVAPPTTVVVMSHVSAMLHVNTRNTFAPARPRAYEYFYFASLRAPPRPCFPRKSDREIIPK